MIKNELRVGNFTSSEIWKLMTTGRQTGGFGEPAITYIKRKNLERKMGRSSEVQKQSRAILWGKFLEKRVYDLLPLSYEQCSKTTLLHPQFDYWAGSPDNLNRNESTVGDTKCYEPQNFGDYVDVLMQKDIELFKKEFPKEYWQLVSNACILKFKHIEPIVYMPYESEIPAIREMAQNNDDPDFYMYRFIAEAPIEELPYLPDGGHYKNLNIFRFEVPEADKELLTNNVEKAGKMLIPRHSTILIQRDEEVKATIVEKVNV